MKKSLLAVSALSLSFILAACGDGSEPVEENERIEADIEAVEGEETE